MNYTANGFMFKSSFCRRQCAFGSEVAFNFNIWEWPADGSEVG